MPILLPVSGTIDISAFEPYVLPFVPNVPLPTFEQMTRLACIEFCRRTLIWTETLPEVITDIDTDFYELDRPDESTVIKALSISLDGQPVSIKTYTEGLAMLRDWSLQCGQSAFLDTESRLHMVPIATEAGLTIMVDAALAPTEDGTVLPGLLLEYKETIGKGALARIYDIPDTTWYNEAQAYKKQAEFDNRIQTMALRVSRGFSSAKIRSSSAPSRWF
jgi:hypothetical protein